MVVRYGIAAAIVASQLAVPTMGWARNTMNLSRKEIRAMPILERPSRPGHFYGNAVRRNAARQMGPQANPWAQ